MSRSEAARIFQYANAVAQGQGDASRNLSVEWTQIFWRPGVEFNPPRSGQFA
ncbi:MAG: hypothetical protein OXC14_03255 [Rhodospirillaceae bacterium]|nr:hypothetical protein [Rhodospirillaceae bacterium]